MYQRFNGRDVRPVCPVAPSGCSDNVIACQARNNTGENWQNFHGQLGKNICPTGEKITGNGWENHRQCLAKLRAMFFAPFGNRKYAHGQRFLKTQIIDFQYMSLFPFGHVHPSVETPQCDVSTSMVIHLFECNLIFFNDLMVGTYGSCVRLFHPVVATVWDAGSGPAGHLLWSSSVNTIRMQLKTIGL